MTLYWTQYVGYHAKNDDNGGTAHGIIEPAPTQDGDQNCLESDDRRESNRPMGSFAAL